MTFAMSSLLAHNSSPLMRQLVGEEVGTISGNQWCVP